MGEIIATIILALLGVVAAYNVLKQNTAPGIINQTAKSSGQVIAALQGR